MCRCNGQSLLISFANMGRISLVEYEDGDVVAALGPFDNVGHLSASGIDQITGKNAVLFSQGHHLSPFPSTNAARYVWSIYQEKKGIVIKGLM